MRKRNVKSSWDMKCDICGKTEHIEEENIFVLSEWWTRQWSSVTFRRFQDDTIHRSLDLCPACTRKFKKLVKNVVIEEDEYGPECSK